jgi:hypothetical protein
MCAVALTVALPAEAIEDVIEMATKEGKPETVILREAIALKQFVEDALRDPHVRLLIAGPGARLQQIIFTKS